MADLLASEAKAWMVKGWRDLENSWVKSSRARRVGSMAAPAAVRRALAANTMACVRLHNNHLCQKWGLTRFRLAISQFLHRISKLGKRKLPNLLMVRLILKGRQQGVRSCPSPHPRRFTWPGISGSTKGQVNSAIHLGCRSIYCPCWI